MPSPGPGLSVLRLLLLSPTNSGFCGWGAGPGLSDPTWFPACVYSPASCIQLPPWHLLELKVFKNTCVPAHFLQSASSQPPRLSDGAPVPPGHSQPSPLISLCLHITYPAAIHLQPRVQLALPPSHMGLPRSTALSHLHNSPAASLPASQDQGPTTTGSNPIPPPG